MKKFASLLLTAVLLAAMLTVFAVPASAAENFMVDTGEEKIISDNAEYGSLRVYGVLEVKANVLLTVDQLTIYPGGKLRLEPGTKIKANKISATNYDLYIPSGVTIEVEGTFKLPDYMVLNSGATLKAKTLENNCKMIVCAGATLIFSHLDNVCEVDLYGTLKNLEDMVFSLELCRAVYYHDGALLDLTFEDNEMAQMFADNMPGMKAEGNRIYKHDKHIIDKACVNCGEGADDSTGSTLSEGSLTIIVGVACLAVGFLVAMFIFKKKKTRTCKRHRQHRRRIIKTYKGAFYHEKNHKYPFNGGVACRYADRFCRAGKCGGCTHGNCAEI